MLKFKIRAVLEAKNEKKPHTALTRMGISKKNATCLLNNTIGYINLADLNEICQTHFCTPNDVFLWMPDSKAWDVEEHPLQELRNPNVPALGPMLRKLSVDNLSKLNGIAEAMLKEEAKKKKKD